MNTEQLRQLLREKWLTYYRDNRNWLVRLGVWVDSEGQRRPSSSFILATLSVLEPRLTELLPLVVDLSSSPDRIVRALGLNFSPDRELEIFEVRESTAELVPMLPSGTRLGAEMPPSKAVHPAAIADEFCRGARGDEPDPEPELP